MIQSPQQLQGTLLRVLKLRRPSRAVHNLGKGTWPVGLHVGSSMDISSAPKRLSLAEAILEGS